MASGREILRPLELAGSKEIRRLLASFNKLQRHIGEQAQSLRQQAHYDLLTKLPNRRLLHELMGQALEIAHRDGRAFAVLHVDLDHFKEINDTLGHEVADRMIVEAGRRIAACGVDEADMVAHMGGDEFVVVQGMDVASADGMEQLAGKILRSIATPFVLGSETIYISASIGVARYPADADNMASLLRNAYQATRAAKSEGRNRCCRFNVSMEEAAQTRMQLAHDLRDALAAKQFEVHYQPIVELATGCIVKAEALLRWRHPQRGLVSPMQFIPIAEETGMISDIGDWVFREAAQTARRWCQRCEFSERGACRIQHEITAGTRLCRHQITVNKSPRQFFSGETHRTWIDYLRQNGIPASCITIEITEGLLLDQNPEVAEKFRAFRDAGIQVALDDFGTGYSAMSYLKKFDIDYLKIDRSFVSDIASGKNDHAIAEAIIVMAHKLGLKVVAEGVETIEQRDWLATAGCDYGQGYLFSRPVPVGRFESLVADHAQAAPAPADAS